MDLSTIVKAIAPMLGEAIGGPVGAMAITTIGNALGLSQATEETVTKAVMGMTPEQSVALQEADIGFKEFMAKLGYDQEKLRDAAAQARTDAANKDTANARELFKTDKRPQMWLSTLFVGGYFVILASVMGGLLQVPENMREIASMLMLLLTREVPTIMKYWFGSDDATDALADSVPADLLRKPM